MAIKKELIQFTLQNISDCNYNIPMMQNTNVVINSTTEYQYNISSADLSCGYGSIVINGVTYNITYQSNSIVSLVAALNNLGFGFFCFRYISTSTTTTTTTVSGSTTSTTTSTTTAAPTTTSTTTSTTTASGTTTSTTTSTTTVSGTTTSTTTSTTTAAPTTTSTTTSTTTVAATTTTSTTTTTTTTAGIVATIAFSYFDNGTGEIDVRAEVTSGTTLDNLTFTGNSNGFQSLGCTGVQFNNTFNFPLFAAVISSVQAQFTPIQAVLSAQATSLSVNGIPITTVIQTINIGGNDYIITGATNCFSPLI
jgi:hypothetical protein